MLEIGPDGVSLFVFDDQANDSIGALSENDKCLIMACIVVVIADFLKYMSYAMKGQSYILMSEDSVFYDIDAFLTSESSSELVAYFPDVEIRFGRATGRIVILDAAIRMTIH